MIGIINYGSGNLGAIANIYKQLKMPHIVSNDANELKRADKFILPGVGAFDATMRNLSESGLVSMLTEQVIGCGKKVLGICVGMQILADSSEEGVLAGLGWISGRVRKIDVASIPGNQKLPHMGWNSIRLSRQEVLFDGVDLERGFYFLHNYHFDAAGPGDVMAFVNYGGDLQCAVGRGNVFGVQFHPEKSHANGVAIFRNFAGL